MSDFIAKNFSEFKEAFGKSILVSNEEDINFVNFDIELVVLSNELGSQPREQFPMVANSLIPNKRVVENIESHLDNLDLQDGEFIDFTDRSLGIQIGNPDTLSDIKYNVFIGIHNGIFYSSSMVSPNFNPALPIISVGIGSIPSHFLPEETGYDKINKISGNPLINGLSLGNIIKKLHEKTKPEELKIGNLKKIEISFPNQFVQIATNFNINDSIILSNRTPNVIRQTNDFDLFRVIFDTILLIPVGDSFDEAMATEQSRKKIIELKIRENLAQINEA